MIPGQRFGRLTAVSRSQDHPRKYVFDCGCGRRFEAFGGNVRKGRTSSCGCAATNNIDRILARVDSSQPGCWEWPKTNASGYPEAVRINGRRQIAYRAIYEACVGPIPSGMVLDHLCINPACVRPDHLEAVSQLENVMRSDGVCARNSKKTHCSNGHEFTPENTATPHTGRGRKCKQCERDYARSAYAKKREAA